MKHLTEDMCQQPNDKTARDSSKSIDNRWQCYVKEILSPVAIPSTGDGDVFGSAAIENDLDIPYFFKFSKKRKSPGEIESSDFTSFDLIEETFLPVIWLNRFHDDFLFGIKSYKTLVIAHLIFLLIQIAFLIVGR